MTWDLHHGFRWEAKNKTVPFYWKIKQFPVVLSLCVQSLILAPKTNLPLPLSVIMLTQSCFIKTAYKLLDIRGVGVPNTWGFITQLEITLSLVKQFDSLGTASSEESRQFSEQQNACFFCLFHSDLFFSVPLLGHFISATSQCFIYGSCSCAVALRVAARGAGDKELRKEGHHTASGAITRMTGRQPPLPVCPIGGWGISKGGAWEAITVIPSPSDHSCQLKSLASKLFMFLYCSILHISLSCSSLICRATSSSL